MQLVAERYSDPGLTVSQMARRAGVCEVYLRRVFQQELQLTPKQYLMQVADAAGRFLCCSPATIR